MMRAEHVHFSYGSREVLRDVSIAVNRGELVCVVGRNGSGKSTLLRLLSGETQAAQGRVTIDDEDITKMSAQTLALRRSVLPQSSALQFGFTVAEVVAMGRIPHRFNSSADRDARVVATALDAVGLQGFADRAFTRLSGGEKQRVHLARVLAQVWPQPQATTGFMLLDEPTSALDVSQMYAALACVKSLCSQGLGALAILHDLNAAARLADRIIVLSDGQVAAEGTPDEAFTVACLREHFGFESHIAHGDDGHLFIIPTHAVSSAPSTMETL